MKSETSLDSCLIIVTLPILLPAVNRCKCKCGEQEHRYFDGELPKSNFIRLNRRLLTDRLKDLYGKEVSDRYLELLNHHFIYKNDETNLANYCASITMYPWLINGTVGVGGNSTAPTNLKSFCGGFVNMVFIVSSMLSGACATPEFLMYMNYFVGLEYGQDYYKHVTRLLICLLSKERSIRL